MSLKLGVRDLSVRDCFLGSVDVTTRADVSIETSGAPCQAGMWKKPIECHLRLNGARPVIQNRIKRYWQNLVAFFKLYGPID